MKINITSFVNNAYLFQIAGSAAALQAVQPGGHVLLLSDDQVEAAKAFIGVDGSSEDVQAALIPYVAKEVIDLGPRVSHRDDDTWWFSLPDVASESKPL